MSAIITLALVSCPPNIEINRKFCMKSCDQAFPDPTFKEGKGLMTFERFLGSCKLSNLTFARLQLYDFRVILQLVAQQRLYNASWRFSASQ